MLDFFKKNTEKYGNKVKTRLSDIDSNHNCEVLLINTIPIKYDSE